MRLTYILIILTLLAVNVASATDSQINFWKKSFEEEEKMKIIDVDRKIAEIIREKFKTNGVYTYISECYHYDFVTNEFMYAYLYVGVDKNGITCDEVQ